MNGWNRWSKFGFKMKWREMASESHDVWNPPTPLPCLRGRRKGRAKHGLDSTAAVASPYMLLSIHVHTSHATFLVHCRRASFLSLCRLGSATVFVHLLRPFIYFSLEGFEGVFRHRVEGFKRTVFGHFGFGFRWCLVVSHAWPTSFTL